MEILRDISLLWSMAHTLVLFLLLFESRYPRRRTLNLTLSTMVPLALVNLVLLMVLGIDRYGTLMLLTLSLPSCILFWFLAKHRDGRFLFTFCMVDTTVLEIVYISNILNHYLTPDSNLVMFLVRLVTLPVLEIAVFRRLRPLYHAVQRRTTRGWGIFAAIGALFYVAITLLMTYPDAITNRPSQLPALVLLFVLMPVIYIHIIATFHAHQALFEMSEQEKIMELQVSNIVKRVAEYESANEAFRLERHDFRHKLKAIAGLAETGQYAELTRAVAEYTGDLDKTAVVRYTRHPVVDAVLSAYLRRAEQAGIPVKLALAFPEQLHVRETELATALANAIENAIHACEALPKEARFLEIKALSSPQFLVMVRNSFAGQVEFGEDGIPVSPEKDHGFGTRSIAAFCSKYGGHYQFKAEEGVFTLFMYLK